MNAHQGALRGPGLGCRVLVCSGRNKLRRRGAAAVLAMMFLFLMSVLALGFYSSTTTAVVIAGNEQKTSKAMLATDSGMQFVKLQLSRVEIPATLEGDDIFDDLEADLRDALDYTQNIGSTTTLARSGDTISIPEISVGADMIFTATIQWDDPVVSVTVTGKQVSTSSSVSRTVAMDYALQSHQSSVFMNAIASSGPVFIKNNSQTNVLGTPASVATVLSASTGSTSITTGAGSIGGDLTVTTAKSQATLGSGLVSGTSGGDRQAHIVVAEPPEFPTVYPSVFRSFAVNTYSSSNTHHVNIYVPAGANPTFAGSSVIDGIVYIAAPNNVTISGGATVNGLVVFEKAGSPSTNTLTFTGTCSPQNIPAGAQFDALRAKATGLAIVAPSAAVTITGNVVSNITGSVLCSSMSLNGSADVNITSGSIVTLGSDTTRVEGKNLNFVGSAGSAPPTTGLRYKGSFKPMPETYREQ